MLSQYVVCEAMIRECRIRQHASAYTAGATLRRAMVNQPIIKSNMVESIASALGHR